MPFLELSQSLSEAVAKALNHPEITPESVAAAFSTPPKPELGHIALPCFQFGKKLGRPSNELAQALAEDLQSQELKTTATGPYVNFRWASGPLFTNTLSKIFSQKDQYGSGKMGKPARVILEYCSPNIAKKLAFQHIRSTLIGNVLANVHEFLGDKVERINFVGDWGTQFSRLLAAVELWGKPESLSEEDISGSMDQLFKLYVRFHKELETDNSYLELASKCLQRLEQKEPKATELWQKIRHISVIAMERTLRRLNVRFDHQDGESLYIEGMEAMLALVKEKSGARLSEGAWIVDVDGVKTPALIQKSDGTTLYLTRDIAAAMDRQGKYDFDEMYYVVSNQQKLHFELLFGVLKKMGCAWADKCHHVSFGTVLFGSERMSTRDGNVIFLDELLDQATALALEECTKKNPDLANKESVAEMVAMGAIIFGELATHRTRDFEFDWKQVLALDGETGPYVQYSMVRCHSLLERAKQAGQDLTPLLSSADVDGELSIEEEVLVLELSRFRRVLHQCIRESEPFYLPRYLIDLAKSFNRFYYQHPVLQATDPKLRQLRLTLVSATRQVFHNGLTLLGIDCPKEM